MCWDYQIDTETSPQLDLIFQVLTEVIQLSSAADSGEEQIKNNGRDLQVPGSCGLLFLLPIAILEGWEGRESVRKGGWGHSAMALCCFFSTDLSGVSKVQSPRIITVAEEAQAALRSGAGTDSRTLIMGPSQSCSISGWSPGISYQVMEKKNA